MYINPDELVHVLATRGEDWADKEAAAQALEESRRAFRAQLAAEYMEKGVNSVAGAELRAEADPRYHEYVRNMTEARRLANIARVNFDSQKAYIELKRSQIATMRAEAQLAGIQR